ncbi:hypothetical protein PAECIP112173_00746 [Paenibacillus sp. JJ-100]|nr:hypothetical protein PAECIP112173_00746 [Paenibacillus sp. JJ-100]
MFLEKVWLRVAKWNGKRNIVIGGLVVLSVTSLGACSAASVEQERKLYNGEATTEGNFRAKQQGHGLNGALVKELTTGLSDRGLKLMHNMFEEDGQGGVSYMFLLNGSARHIVKLHVYPDANVRSAQMENMYGEPQENSVLENALSRTTIRSKGHVSLVYSSFGGEKDKYERDVLQVFEHVLHELRE